MNDVSKKEEKKEKKRGKEAVFGKMMMFEVLIKSLCLEFFLPSF